MFTIPLASPKKPPFLVALSGKSPLPTYDKMELTIFSTRLYLHENLEYLAA